MLMLTRKELETKKKLELLEEFHPDVLVNAVHQMKTEIQKGIITQEDFDEYWPIETKSFKSVMVVENDLSKRLRLIRSQQVRWDETTIKKSIGEREGVYMDTLRNREFGIVGMPWGYDIIKGKRAVIGEIRYYGGVPYRKVSATGKAHKDWQVVKDMAKKPGAKGGEKHEEVKEEKLVKEEELGGWEDVVMSSGIISRLKVGNDKYDIYHESYPKAPKGEMSYYVKKNGDSMGINASGDANKDNTDVINKLKNRVLEEIKSSNITNTDKKEGIFQIEEKVKFTDNYGHLREGVVTKIEGDLIHGKQINSPNSFIRNIKDVVKIEKKEETKKPEEGKKHEDKVDTTSLRSYSLGESLNDHRNWDWKISKIADGVDDFNDGEVTLVNIPNSYGGNGETKKESYALLKDNYSKNKKLSSIEPDKKDKPTKTITPKDIVKLFKNKEDWGDMGDYVSVVDGKLQVVDSFYYGGAKRLESLKKDWTEESGSYAKYFKEEYGIKFKLTESDVQTFATGKYKKLFGDNMGMVLIKLEVKNIQ